MYDGSLSKVYCLKRTNHYWISCSTPPETPIHFYCRSFPQYVRVLTGNSVLLSPLWRVVIFQQKIGFSHFLQQNKNSTQGRVKAIRQKDASPCFGPDLVILRRKVLTRNILTVERVRPRWDKCQLATKLSAWAATKRRNWKVDKNNFWSMTCGGDSQKDKKWKLIYS